MIYWCFEALVYVYGSKSELLDEAAISPAVYISAKFWYCVFAASQAAAEARGSAGKQSAAVSSFTGISLQEAQQILNVSTLNPEEIQKVHQEVSPLQPIGSHVLLIQIICQSRV